MSTSRQAPALIPVPAPVMMIPAANIPMVQIKLPEPFTGERATLRSFIQDCYVHVLHHKATFNHDDKKIIFMLSLITGGMAKAWKENWLAEKIAANDLGTFDAFKATLEKTFTQIDERGHARAILKTMRQKKGKLAEYISDFKIQAGWSGIDSEPALAEYFMEGIQPEILKDIFRAGAIPTKMEEWYNETSWIELQQLQLKEIEDQRKELPTTTKDTMDTTTAQERRIQMPWMWTDCPLKN